ncbi:protein FAR-RED ELONGATED HYPOCOTYL 3-like [Daucus carota subsp. sativus]|uniref:protein FAR-RED ELONGATED HYPOCOTYL 3-like n=1 Tax=Daucus carota subsp. sativus TaxID=79200 RepID=UPI0007F0084B|nr:PREDICTED: protein FAR-RED ELONGATED HYPOCOTYL 3-like [Daucus carota subsp. sativus]
MSDQNPDASAPDVPHIESSDSEHSFRDFDDESGETDEDSVYEIDDAWESIGPRRATDKVFMSKLKFVIYQDHSSPLEFEEGWSSVISEYKLQDNEWMSAMFRKRRSWIPAYFSDIDIEGFLRTTSRSESFNSFFQHFHESGDTLVEFFSSFESAMDKQRIRTVEDDKNSRKTPRLETPLLIEKDAAHVYTLALYYHVREEIKNACFHTSMPEMTQTNETRVFMCKDDLLKGKLFKQCGIHTIPRQFIKARWTKDALKNHSSIGSLETSSNCDKTKRTKLKRTRAWFEFESCLDLVGDEEDKLDMVRLLLRDIESKLQKDSEQNDELGQAHRADAFIEPVPLNEECVRNPNICKNKGSGSRIKSTREISIQSKGQCTCNICNKTKGHNARTCPTLKK